MNSTAEANNPRGDPAAQDRRPWLETPLDTSRSCIRVLNLHKGSDDMPIVCSLKVASLDDDPYYESLSYVWGDFKDTRSLTVDGVAFNATANLFNFLRCLRLPTADRYIWADAICIDQSNNEEKNYQIRLMTKIYRQAKQAHIWFGPFCKKSWYQEITHDKGYVIAFKMTPRAWENVERVCEKDLQYFVNQEEFKPLSHKEFHDFGRRCQDDIFLQTLTILDRIAETVGGEHLYTYPVFSFVDKDGSGRQYQLNRYWLVVLDCIRWLITRSWWTRVWTLQEAVLPRVDPIVHAPPYSFELPRLLNGIYAMMRHNGLACCKWFGRVILTQYRDCQYGHQFKKPLAVFAHRKSLTYPGQEWVPLEHIVKSIQGRKATDIWDHWFGIFGLLPPQWQDADRSCSEPWTTTEAFTKCSKLLFSNCKDLTRLDLARGLRKSKVSSLPSWAIDLSAQLPEEENDYDRWELYNASRGIKYEGVRLWPELRTPYLTVKAICVGTVLACAERVPPDAFKSRDISSTVLKFVRDWRELYHDHVQPADEDAFWRAAFMDRDVQRDRMARRTNPLIPWRVKAIMKWWRNWNRTGDRQDLDVDRKAGGSNRGNFHYRALELNVEKARFFITTQGIPGMGPHDIQPSDKVYVLAGCKSLAVLRQGSRNGTDCVTFVGLCFLDGWMYGRATQGSPAWETLRLY